MDLKLELVTIPGKKFLKTEMDKALSRCTNKIISQLNYLFIFGSNKNICNSTFEKTLSRLTSYYILLQKLYPMERLNPFMSYNNFELIIYSTNLRCEFEGDIQSVNTIIDDIANITSICIIILETTIDSNDDFMKLYLYKKLRFLSKKLENELETLI